MFGRRTNKNELDPPPIAAQNPAAVEVLRVWAAPGESQQVALQVTWKDPRAWGLMLVDIARHAANAYEVEGLDPDAVLDSIRKMWDAEWSDPTDEPQNITPE